MLRLQRPKRSHGGRRGLTRSHEGSLAFQGKVRPESYNLRLVTFDEPKPTNRARKTRNEPTFIAEKRVT